MTLESQAIAVFGSLLLIPVLVWLHRKFARRYLSPILYNDIFGFEDDD